MRFSVVQSDFQCGPDIPGFSDSSPPLFAKRRVELGNVESPVEQEDEDKGS